LTVPQTEYQNGQVKTCPYIIYPNNKLLQSAHSALKLATSDWRLAALQSAQSAPKLVAGDWRLAAKQSPLAPLNLPLSTCNFKKRLGINQTAL